MKKTLVALSLASLFTSIVAVADTGYINVRHQYAEQTRMHADRAKFGMRLDNGVGLEGELKYKTAGDREDVAFDNTVGSGHEFTVNYQHKIDDRWTLTPSFAMESDEESTTYKMGMRLGYKITKELSIAGRYRYDSSKLDRDKIDRDVPDNGQDDQKIHRYDVYINYANQGPWAYEYQLTYFDANYIRYNGGTDDYEQNAVVKYKWDKRRAPFFEVGDIKVNSVDNDRQLRLRVGIQYNFF
ncbi:porin [Pseudomonas sp. Z3-6]|uniref:oligogalacturonate-specific porin KdgM family protein n=1 Tax=Pseudomonas sp. Z3-6 TaxID=2817411 RepID=UPI003DA8BBB1